MDKQGALGAAFPRTVPVMTGYLFLGMAFGILLESKGYGIGWAGLMSVTIYAGSMQFVGAELLVSAFSLLNTAFITLMVNARHIFYGLSMLDKFKDMGRQRPYMIFSLTDETFSLFCSVQPPPGVNANRFYLWIALLDQLYWITGSLIGAALGAVLPIDSTGIDFVMTALFVVIFIEQWRPVQNRIPSLIGLGGSALCLLVFGPDRFILPAMVVLAGSLTLLRGPIERGMNQ